MLYKHSSASLGNSLRKPRRRKFRPDLSDYEILIMALVDKLNENAVYKMNKTDAVKIAIEKAVKAVLPGIVVKPKRKRYIKIDF